jgi:hypothetical protein
MQRHFNENRAPMLPDVGSRQIGEQITNQEQGSAQPRFPTETKRDPADPKDDLFFISSVEGAICLSNPEALYDDQALSPNWFGHLHDHGFIHLNDHRAGETVQRGSIGSTRILVLAHHRRTKMLVRRQAHALEVIAGMAGADVGAFRFQPGANRRGHAET